MGTGVTETSGRPMSLSLRSSPCRADWSATGPWRTVVPSSWWVRVMPSNQVAQRGARCPRTRISYRSAPPSWLPLLFAHAAKVSADVVSGHHHMW